MSDIKKDDIVYFVKGNYAEGFKVDFGIVDDVYKDGICVDYLHLKENRLINGVPINDFKTPTKKSKLPKGWTYNTELFKLTFEEVDDEVKTLKINNPSDIKKAFEKGYLVKMKEIDQCNIEADISKDGYFLARRYEPYTHKLTGSLIQKHKLFKTYEEADNLKKSIEEEFQRQASLTDEEWSKEQILKTLNHYNAIYGSSNYIERVKDFLFSLKNIEDIEVRISNSIIQYKYWKNKRWINLDEDARWD